MKTLYDISWQVTEPEYRHDTALSYSTLANFNRTGFNGLSSLGKKITTSSLTFGSQVDTLITGSQEEYDALFYVSDFPDIKDSVKNIINKLYDLYYPTYPTLKKIPDNDVIELATRENFNLHWRPETRAKVIKEQGGEYYYLLTQSQGKTVVSCAEKESVDQTVQALKTSPSTALYFAPNDEFDTVQRFYQLKFKDASEGINYRCMMDLAVVDNDNKIIYPCDLKTSSHAEWDFYQSFVEWGYHIQARLYWRLLRATMDRDELFKDYTLANYTFIVVNKNTLTPLTWEFEDTKTYGTLYYGRNKDIIFRDPYDLGKELTYYLQNHPNIPVNITTDTPNSLSNWLNTL